MTESESLKSKDLAITSSLMTRAYAYHFSSLPSCQWLSQKNWFGLNTGYIFMCSVVKAERKQ